MSPTRSRWIIRVGNLVFVSGQAAVDEHGEAVGGADFDAQARQAGVRQPGRGAGNAGSGLEHVVTVTDMAVIDQVIGLRREFLPGRPGAYPAADTIAQVVSSARPEWRIEIKAIAVRGQILAVPKACDPAKPHAAACN